MEASFALHPSHIGSVDTAALKIAAEGRNPVPGGYDERTGPGSFALSPNHQ